MLVSSLFWFYFFISSSLSSKANHVNWLHQRSTKLPRRYDHRKCLYVCVRVMGHIKNKNTSQKLKIHWGAYFKLTIFWGAFFQCNQEFYQRVISSSIPCIIPLIQTIVQKSMLYGAKDSSLFNHTHNSLIRFILCSGGKFPSPPFQSLTLLQRRKWKN